MIQSRKLIIDENCPICASYGNWFIKLKLIDKQTIVHYQTINQKLFDQIDAERAKSEVAFLNPRSGKIKYGIDAFLEILTQKSKVLKSFFSLVIVYFLAKKLYRFISFNRHMISGGLFVENTQRNCVPAIHKPYRWAYLIIAALFTGFMVNEFTFLVDQKAGVSHSAWREYVVCFGQVVWQFIALSFIHSNKRLAYLGNMSTVSIIGGVLLIPLLLLNFFFDLSLIQLLLGFSLIVSTMLVLHIKRCKQLGLPLLVSLSWVVFRTLVLIIVLLFIYLFIA